MLASSSFRNGSSHKSIPGFSCLKQRIEWDKPKNSAKSLFENEEWRAKGSTSSVEQIWAEQKRERKKKEQNWKYILGLGDSG